MTTCDPDSGERFVAGLLNQAEESSFLEHLNTCADCRATLEAAAGDAEAWQAAKELLAYSCAAEAGVPRHESADFTRAGAASEADEAVFVVDPSSLSFLAPSDDPAMMGRIGPYEIMAVLGRGGFGMVLKGHDRALDRNVAIKVLDPAAATVGAARERFAREARAMAAISHEHVVPVYAVDTHAGLPYFVMEYVAGGSLERRLRTEGRFDAVSIVRIGLQMAQALSAAHNQGLVHRDIKPGNVLIDQGTERVRVADFGLARVANDVSATRSGFLAGTPQYMAPEQVRGETCDAQSDLFSLGAVMYALCTGHAPFRAESIYGVMQRIVHDVPRPIRDQNPLVPAWLEQFILRLLEKDKSRRFASSDEVARLLQQELAHLQNPALVPEPRRSWRASDAPARGPRSRRRLAIACGVACALVVVGAFGYWFWPEPQGTAARQDTKQQQAPQKNPENSMASNPTESAAADRVAPLWTADGTRNARETADRLEARWRARSTARSDPWTPQAADLLRRLAKLSSELEPPARQPAPANEGGARK